MTLTSLMSENRESQVAKARRVRRRQHAVVTPISENDLFLHLFITGGGGW